MHVPDTIRPTVGTELEAEMLFSRKDGRAPETGERRADARLDKVFRVYLEGERGMGLGIARNISEGGMFIETRAPQPIGSQVRISFPSEAGPMTAVAEVRYVCHLLGRPLPGPGGPSARRGMGVRFLYFEAGEAAPPDQH